RRASVDTNQARVVDLQVGAAGRTVQLADRRRAKAFRIGRAQQQFIGDLPAQAVLRSELAAEGRVVRVAPGQAEVEALAERALLDQRQVELDVGFVDVVLARGRQRRHA